MEGVNDRLLDHCQVSSVPHYCGFKEQEIPSIFTVWMVIYWNSNVNIQIFWDTGFWLSLGVSSNHQNENKNTFEVFYFTCNESKIYESFTFEISYKKKWTYSPFYFIFRCTCIYRALSDLQLCRSFTFTYSYITHCMKGNIGNGIIAAL